MLARASQTLRRRATLTPARNISSLVNLDTHPIDRLESDSGAKLLENCRSMLSKQGFVSLPAFLQPAAAAAMAEEALALECRNVGFHSTEQHGVFLTADDDSSKSKSKLSPRHPRRVVQSSSKTLFAADQLSATSPLKTLYEWAPMLAFVRAALSP